MFVQKQISIINLKIIIIYKLVLACLKIQY